MRKNLKSRRIKRRGKKRGRVDTVLEESAREQAAREASTVKQKPAMNKGKRAFSTDCVLPSQGV